MACSGLCDSLKLLRGCCSSLDPSDSKSCALPVESASRKDSMLFIVWNLQLYVKCRKVGNCSSLCLVFPPASLHSLMSVVPLKMHLSSSREPCLSPSSLTAPGAPFQCYLNSQCLLLSLYLTTAAATHHGLPWWQTLS